MKKTILAILLAAGCLLPMHSAFAAYSAIDAFGELTGAVSATGPGYYTSATRGAFVGGSLRIWVPRDKVTLISLSGPSISAGCGGISAYFGGMSFINGTQIKQLVTNIMQSTIGYTVNLALRTLCPLCSDILTQMQKLAQDAARGNIDSCQAATGLVNKGLTSLGLSGFGARQISATCSSVASNLGAESSYGSAVNSVCQGQAKAMKWLDDAVDSVSQIASHPDKAAQFAARTASKTGNGMWAAMTIAGYSNTYIKEMLLSGQGAWSFKPPEGDASGKPYFYPGWSLVVPRKDDGSVTVNNPGQILLDILVFGVDPSQTAKLLPAGTVKNGLAKKLDYAKTLNLGSLPFISCRGKDPDGHYVPAPASTPFGKKSDSGKIQNVKMCDSPEPDVTLADVAKASVGDSIYNPFITKTGLLGYVGKALSDAVADIATGRAIPLQAIQLMQITPLPLYKMVNIAAVYPAVASQLVSNYSTLVAYLVARSVVNSWIQATTNPAFGAAVGSADMVATLKSMKEMISDLSMSTNGTGKQISKALNLQNQILGSIHQINQVMYASLAGSGMQGNLLFSQSVAAGITPQGKGQ